MALNWNVLALLVAALLVPFFLFLGWALHYHFSTTQLPPGMCQSLKIRLVHIGLVMLCGWDYVFWNMGLCCRFALLRLAMDGIPPLKDPRLSIRNDFFEGVPVRIYQPKRPPPGLQRGILFFHGGCGVIGSIDAYERFCRYIARESGSVLISVGYCLAPESPYPSQFEECHDASVHFLRNAENYGVDPAQIILCGDSFGGTLTAYLCQELKSRTDLPKVRAQALLYPFLQALDVTLPSCQQNCFFPVLTRRDLLRLALYYIGKPSCLIETAIAGNLFPEDIAKKYRKWVHSDRVPSKFRIRNHNPALPASPKDNLFRWIHDILDRKLSPLLADDSFLKELPETFILTCEYDILRDSGLLYKKRLEENGVQVSWYHLENGFHGAPVLLNHWLVTFPCAKTAADSFINYIRDTYERFCRYIAKESGSVLISVGYRLTPESPYPSQFEECHDASVHLLRNAKNYGVHPARIILCGDSLGGTLTAYLCQELKSRTDLPKVRAQALLYPFLQALEYHLPSYQQNCFFPIITQTLVIKLAALYLDKPLSLIDIATGGNMNLDSLLTKYKKWVHSDHIPQEFRTKNCHLALPATRQYDLFTLLQSVLLDRKLSPLLAEDSFLKGLPEAFILTCEYDVLRDDGLLYKKRLEDNGVLVSWYHVEDGFHASLALLHHWFITFSHCKIAVDSVVNYVKGL